MKYLASILNAIGFMITAWLIIFGMGLFGGGTILLLMSVFSAQIGIKVDLAQPPSIALIIWSLYSVLITVIVGYTLFAGINLILDYYANGQKSRRKRKLTTQ